MKYCSICDRRRDDLEVCSLPLPVSVAMCEECRCIGAVPVWVVETKIEEGYPWWQDGLIFHNGGYMKYSVVYGRVQDY